MNMYSLIRRNAWTPATLEAGAARSDAENAKRTDQVRHIRTYVLDEGYGRVGTICFYQAVSEQALRDQFAAADLPDADIVPISGVNVVRPDPDPDPEG